MVVMGIFAIKQRIFKAQRIRYRQRLRELGDNSGDFESENRRSKEAAQLAQSILLEDQRKVMSGSQTYNHEGGMDFAASQRSLALARAAAGNMNVSTMTLPKAERSLDIRFENLGLTLPTGVDIIKVWCLSVASKSEKCALVTSCSITCHSYPYRPCVSEYQRQTHYRSDLRRYGALGCRKDDVFVYPR